MSLNVMNVPSQINATLASTSEGRALRRTIVTALVGGGLLLANYLSNSPEMWLSGTGVFLMSGFMGLQKYVKEKWSSE